MKARLEDKNKIGIYLILNKVNNKCYIGKSINIYSRIKNHIGYLNLKSKKHENEHLINAWMKYGRTNFDYFVIEECLVENLSEKELYYIDLYQTTDKDKGYNFRKDSSTGMICSEETREKMRLSRKQRDKKFPDNRELTSIRFKLFWENNPHIKKSMSNQVSNKIRKYKIAKLDYQSNKILEIFEKRSDINEKYPDYYTQAILGCCSGTKKSYKGFKWCYIDRVTNEQILKHKHKI